MQAAILKKPYDLEIVDYPLSKLSEKELRIQVEACGLCGTDLHIYAGEAPASPPVILGHEYVGKIVEKGAQVFDFEIGDKVAVDPNIHCGFCSFCRKGEVHLCNTLKALGVNKHGGFAEFSVVPASQAYLLPKEFPGKWAAFAEPLSCCLRGIQRASINPGDSVTIVGGGTIGLLMLQLARLEGSAKTLLLEPIPEKRHIAKQLSADYVLNPNSGEGVLKQVNDITAGGADVVIECVGSREAAELSVKLAKRGGTVIIFGLAAKSSTLRISLHDLFHRELTIKGSLLNPFTFQTAVDLLVSKRIQVEPLNPVSVSLSNISALISKPRNSSVVKYQVLPNNC
jgi:2-desacetyl-2-hydroxyethyl bacteriochlorophyllide A dehydrogenase